MADSSELALESLLDAFPDVPLDLIATAFTQARGDPHLAAEIITDFPKNLSFSSSNSASHSPRNSGNPRFPKKKSQDSEAKTQSQDSNAKQQSQNFTSRSAPGRLAGPSPPTLQDFFPPTQENAWIAPLQERLETNAMLQQLSIHDADQPDAFESEFPSLGLQDVPKTGVSVRSPVPTFMRSSKRVSAASGLIPNVRISATLEAKDNVVNRRIKRRGRNCGLINTGLTEIDAPQLSVLDDGFEFGLEAARDVLGGYGGDVEKSYEGMVDEEAEKKHPSELGRKSNIHQDMEEEMLKQEHSSMKWVEERLCREFPSADVGTLKEILRVTKFNYSDAEKMLVEAGAKDITQWRGKNDHAELPNVILESFFKDKEEEKTGTNAGCLPQKKTQKDPLNSLEPVWTVATAAESSTLKFEESVMHVRSYGDWNHYERHDKSAKQQWQTMEQYFKAASSAYAGGDACRAELLLEKGKQFKKLATEARERANNYLLEVKNLENGNDFILDLQEQHVTEALRLLKLHLQFLSPIPSCHNFTVIIGTDNDLRPGRSKVRQEVVRYLEKKEIEWIETSAFCLQVKLKKIQL